MYDKVPKPKTKFAEVDRATTARALKGSITVTVRRTIRISNRVSAEKFLLIFGALSQCFFGITWIVAIGPPLADARISLS